MPRTRRVLRALRAAALLSTALAASATVAATSAGATPAPPAKGAGPGFAVLRDVDPTIQHDIRYLTSHNFLGVPVDGYREPLCVLSRPAAQALARAQRTLLRRGYTLKVYDCYRPQRAVNHFVRWGEDLRDQKMKKEFYPRLDKSVLFNGYIARKSGHSRGSTVDLTVVRLPKFWQRQYRPGEPLVECYLPRKQRFPDTSIDMGTGYDCLDTQANTDDPRVTGQARANRVMLREVLNQVGFTNFPNEWWHYTLRNEPYPDTYFDFPVARRSVPRG